MQQFIQQFGPHTATRSRRSKTILSSNGPTNLTVADNQLLIQNDGSAANTQGAFNTSLSPVLAQRRYRFREICGYSSVSASLSGAVLAVLD